MRITEVVESKHWKNKVTGRTASIYGAAPSGDDWEIESRGWTWRTDQNTVGLYRKPAKTKQEAIDFMNNWNRR